MAAHEPRKRGSRKLQAIQIQNDDGGNLVAADAQGASGAEVVALAGLGGIRQAAQLALTDQASHQGQLVTYNFGVRVGITLLQRHLLCNISD